MAKIHIFETSKNGTFYLTELNILVFINQFCWDEKDKVRKTFLCFFMKDLTESYKNSARYV